MALHDTSARSILAETLHKANDAVIFDYEQNFAYAIQAYGDSCALLGQVMRVHLQHEDRTRLDCIVCKFEREEL